MTKHNDRSKCIASPGKRQQQVLQSTYSNATSTLLSQFEKHISNPHSQLHLSATPNHPRGIIATLDSTSSAPRRPQYQLLERRSTTSAANDPLSSLTTLPDIAMHVLVIGGSGKTGQLVVKEALKRGFTVTVLLRNPKSLTEFGANNSVTLVEGALGPVSIDKAMSTPCRPDAVIVTLNQRLATGSPFSAFVGPAYMMADAHDILLDSMSKHGVRRLVTMSAFGTGESFKNLNCMLRGLFRYSNMKYQFEDHDEVDKRVKAAAKASGLQYTLARPVMLADAPPAEGIVVKDNGDKGEGVGLMAKISRESVAGFLVDAAANAKWVGRTPVISNAAEKA